MLDVLDKGGLNYMNECRSNVLNKRGLYNGRVWVKYNKECESNETDEYVKWKRQG